MLTRLIEIVYGFTGRFDLAAAVSAHPCTEAQMEGSGTCLSPQIYALKLLESSNCVRLQTTAQANLSDSRTVSEGSYILNLRELNICEAHERHKAIGEASVMMVSASLDRMLRGLEILTARPRGGGPRLQPVAEYSMLYVFEMMVRVFASSTHYVSGKMWMEA